ncbi:MAG: permease-like cell division protein FtsX [Patescibacteria group bacterium]|nr:permease-like cell division protein FtsX [Patescibacteria group bacterium]
MLTSFKRIIRAGFKNFYRNSLLSATTIFVMVIVVSLVTVLFLFNSVFNILISDIQDKVDISIYFKEDVATENILEIRSQLAEIPEVKEVKYISKEEAFTTFVERHKDDPILIESLDEVGKNPFLSSLGVKAQQASEYQEVVNFLDNNSFNDLIEKIDYYERKPVIDKVFSITESINKTGIIFSVILGLIAILIVFNTIRIAIYSSKKEISTMKLVGASNWFIQGPFLIQGILVGIFSTIITLLITFAICYGFDSKINAIVSDVRIFNIFTHNFWTILLIQITAGIGLGIIPTIIAVKKYLKI